MARSKTAPSSLCGVLNIDKPAGMTSHDVVDHVRKAAHMRKVGHTGTLDPMATGVLPLCLGRATRIAQFLIAEDKEYRVRMRLGLVTDSQDTTGKVIEERDPGELDPARVAAVLEGFVGERRQIPPMISAKHHEGKRLYELAREGVEVEREPITITVHEILFHGICGREVEFTVACGKGTYIRTLCHDMGQALGVGAAMSGLVRTRCGALRVEDAVPLAELTSRESVESHLCSMAEALSTMAGVQVDARQVGLLRNGQPATGGGVLAVLGEFGMGARVRILDAGGHLVAVGKSLISSANLDRLGGNLHVVQPLRVLLEE
ncbi:tRNA pseudouridine(55) synthase TruB [bacterium]|nr:tRNA pseudouridine(55) synthase TruB [bacterium]